LAKNDNGDLPVNSHNIKVVNIYSSDCLGEPEICFARVLIKAELEHCKSPGIDLITAKIIQAVSKTRTQKFISF
jgi:hypothetical protein